MLNRFTHNWVLKITSIVLALALWSHVRGEVNPWETATFKVRLRADTPRGWVLQNAENLPQSVAVTVRAPRLTLRALKGGTPANPLSSGDEATPLSSRQMRASLDFSTPRKGNQKVPVKAEANLQDVEVIGAKPSEMAVTLDAAARREMKIQAQWNLPSSWQAQGVTVSTQAAQVAGASEVLARVARVAAKIEKPVTRAGGVEIEAPLQAFDAKGREVEGVQLEPSTVRVRAQISERQDEKTIPVEVSIRGQAARGYELQAAEVSPSRATIRGPRRVLKNLEKLSVAIDAGNARDTISKRALLSTPPGIELISPRRVRVQINVRRLEAPAPYAETSSRESSTPATSASKPAGNSGASTLPAPAHGEARP